MNTQLRFSRFGIDSAPKPVSKNRIRVLGLRIRFGLFAAAAVARRGHSAQAMDLLSYLRRVLTVTSLE